MGGTLARQVTVISLLIGLALVALAVLGFGSLLRSRAASTHLAEHVLTEIEASHAFNMNLVRAVGEAESYARGREQADRNDAQTSMAAAQTAIATLDSLAADAGAESDGLDATNEMPALQQDRHQLIAQTEAILARLDNGENASDSAISDDIEALAEPIDALARQVETRNERITAGATRAVQEANQGATLSLGIAFGLLALLIGLAIAGLRYRVIHPLHTLETATHNMAGNAVSEIAVTRNDEFGKVQSAFNKMAATIRGQTERLEQQLSTAEAARAQSEAAHRTIEAQLAELEQQRLTIRDMSVPVLPVDDQTLVLPLVGNLDSARLTLLQERALGAIESARARNLILDITAVPIVDSQVAQGIIMLVQAVSLLGACVILVGVRPEVAQSLVGLGLTLDTIITKQDLREGMAYARLPQAKSAHSSNGLRALPAR